MTIPIEFENLGGAEAIDHSVSPASLTFGASETDKTLRVSLSNDSVVDPGESVTLSFGTPLPERISEGGTRGSDGRDPRYGLHLRPGLRGRLRDDGVRRRTPTP